MLSKMSKLKTKLLLGFCVYYKIQEGMIGDGFWCSFIHVTNVLTINMLCVSIPKWTRAYVPSFDKFSCVYRCVVMSTSMNIPCFKFILLTILYMD